MIRIVEDACRFAGSGGVVVIESDKDAGNLAIEELLSGAARQAAITYAQTLGMAGAGVSGTPSTYPVDEEGRVIEKAGAAPDRYRADIPVTARLV